MNVFWQNMGIRTVIFPWKIGKEGHPIDFLDTKYSVVLTELTFLTKYGLDNRGFSMKILRKNEMRAQFFERMDVFLREGTFFNQNMGLRAVCFFENRRIFDKIWAWEQRFFLSKSEKKEVSYDFLAYKKWALDQRVLYRIDVFLTKYGHESNFLREKIKKKGILSTFLAHEIESFSQNWRFSTKYGHDSRGIFMKVLKKMTLEHNVFERMHVFLTKYGNESCLFFRE